ncbi:MAG: DoxX family protein [Acidobacteriota bacterium]
MSKSPQNSTDLALLVLRLGFGVSMFAFHGWGKISGGPELWERLGGVMALFGISFAPVFWGLLAALAESVGSALIALGLFTRPAAVVLAGTMVVAAWRHLSLPAGADGAGFSGASHALEYLVVYAVLILAGAGKYSVDAKRK